MPTSTPLAPHVPAGSTANEVWDVDITPEAAGWGYTSIRVGNLPAQGTTFDTGRDEVVVVPLSGAVEVRVGGEVHALGGRASVFSGPTDVLYVPQGTQVTVQATGDARVAVAGSRVPEGAERLPVWLRRGEDTGAVLRGAGRCTRQVQGFAGPDAPAEHRMHKIIAVEVITPGGNWSSYPPHKHDETSEHESELEEIYYYEVAAGPDGQPGVGYHRTYGTEDRPVEVLAEVRTGDTVLVPHGWHGPAVASPGNDLYYLNVMAGPGEGREWRVVDDPDHAWIKSTWQDQATDPRLPLGR